MPKTYMLFNLCFCRRLRSFNGRCSIGGVDFRAVLCKWEKKKSRPTFNILGVDRSEKLVAVLT